MKHLPSACAPRSCAATRVASAFLLACLFVVPAGAGDDPEPPPVCGDVNASGGLTTSDALLVLKSSVGQEVELSCEGYQSLIDGFASDLGTCEGDLSSCNAELWAANEKPVCGDGVCELLESEWLGKCNVCISDCVACSSDGTRFYMHGSCDGQPMTISGRMITFCPAGGSCEYDPAYLLGASCPGVFKVGCFWMVPDCSVAE